jgi:tetratricopeptide (TPR) repeat protein
MGEMEKALDLLNKALAIDPNSEKNLVLKVIAPFSLFSHLFQARFLTLSKRDEEAQKTYDKLAEISPESSIIMHNTAQKEFEAGNYEKALEWVERGLKRDSKRNATVMLKVCVVYYVTDLFIDQYFEKNEKV